MQSNKVSHTHVSTFVQYLLLVVEEDEVEEKLPDDFLTKPE